MPKGVTNDVETLLMLDPTGFAIDESWDLEEVSSNIRRFASDLEKFAEGLDQRRSVLSADENQSKAAAPVTPKAEPSAEPVPQPGIQRTGGRNRARRGRSNTIVKSQAYSTRSAEKAVTTSAKKSKKEETTSDGTSGQYEDEIVAYTSKDVIGCYIAKEFDAGTFRGQVESVDEGELLYSVTYSDGDQEEMTVEDLSKALMLFANHQRQSIFKDLSKKDWLDSLGLRNAKKKSRQLAQALMTKAPDDIGERTEGVVAIEIEEEATTKTISASAQSIADLDDSASATKPTAKNPSGIDEETAEKECPENESPETPEPKDSIDEALPVGYGTFDEQANAMQSPGDDETSNGKRRRLNA